MDKTKLIAVAEQILLPMLPGSKLDGDSISTTREETVAFIDPQRIAFKVNRSDAYRLKIYRPQPFGKMRASELNECDVIIAFTAVANEMQSGLVSFHDDLMPGFERRVVAHTLVRSPGSQKLLMSIISQLQTWSSMSYEGGQIAASIAVDVNVDGTGPHFNDIVREDASMVLSNGFDTLLRFGKNGKLIRHECLTHATATNHFAPYRMTSLATYASNPVIVFVLNRLGEVLIFSEKKLIFARRFGRWFFLTHETALNQMHHPHNRLMRTAVFESALDASFARTGACLGVVSNANKSRWKSIVAPSDQLASSTTTKVQTINNMISGRTFDKLDRRIRQELLAIDGATLIDHHGVVLAVGAILRVPGGSSGGGRKAASIQLGSLGLGLKISQDGGITGFSGISDPAFTVMA